MNLAKISPERFTWKKYIGSIGYSVTQLMTNPYYSSFEGKNRLISDVKPVGYCEASRIRIRNRNEGFVIMVEFYGEDIWFHVIEAPYGITFV